MSGEREPIIDVVAHPPRYMVRCSACGIIASELTPREAVDERYSHRCPAPSEPQ